MAYAVGIFQGGYVSGVSADLGFGEAGGGGDAVALLIEVAGGAED